MLALVGALGVLASGLATTTDVVSAAADGYGTAIGNLVSGPTVQSASNSWQYFEIPDSLSSATLLPNWQTTGNECVLNQNQWDNNRVNGNYPFVQFVQTRPASNLHGGNTFGANAELLIHPDNSSYRAAIGWKNTTGATVLIDYAATLKLAFPQNNNDGIAYSFQRGLSGTARYLSLKSGTISNGSTATSQLNGSLVELQSGELVYLTVGNKGNYYWDHTIATMSISLTSPPTSSVVGADTVVTFSSVGSRTWTVPAGVSSVRYLVVGGGGGGGSDNGGGGGAGGYLAGLSLATTPGDSKLVVVGDGGAGAVNASSTASNGGNSSFANIVALGGGGGGSIDNTAGADGGSAGGRAANRSQIAQGATATTSSSQGNNGGGKNSGGFGGGGGGGASTAGANGGSNIGGNGGAGQTNNISGVDVAYAGGGGGGGDSNTAGTGGNGGGGNGSRRGDEIPTQGVDGLGGGGGAAGGSVAGGLGKRGGSGIVIVRYTTPAAPTNTAAPVISGTTRTGATLTTTDGSWSGSPSSYTYQWKRASTSGGTYSNISSATNSTYVLTDADIDKYIKVSVIATNGIGASSAELSAASSIVADLPDSIVPTVTTSVSTATGFTFTISNYSASYTYVLTTSKGSVSRSTDDVTVTGLTAGESATVTIAVTRANYKAGSKTVTGSATPAVTTTTAAPALSIVIQAPVTTVAQGQASVATLAPTPTTLPVLGANGVPSPTTTTTVAPVNSKAVVTTTLPKMVTTTTVGPPVVDKVDAGQTAVQVDGVKTAATVTRENNQMVVTAGALSATLSGLDKTGKRSPLDSDGNIHLDAGDEIKISVGGFKPKSLVEVWLFSTPTQLGSAVVGADGTVSETYRLPAGTKSGTHRVVVTARLANGKPTSFTLGILVGDISTTSTLTRVLIAIPIALAIGFGFLLPNQLRRRRKTRIA